MNRGAGGQSGPPCGHDPIRATMRRREFIRNTALLSASTFFVPALSSRARGGAGGAYEPLQSLQLTDFSDEQDENPILFGNRTETFLVTLRRRSHPSDHEVIPLFRLEGDTWRELPPVVGEGCYEAVSADCHPDGAPMVAWTAIEAGRWVIRAALRDGEGFGSAAPISDPSKRSINPVVKAITADSHLVAWECFENGKFCIYLTRHSKGQWTKPRRVTDRDRNCFHPALEQDARGNIHLACDVADGPHRNIELRILSPGFELKETVPVAVGGAFVNRVNLNVKPALAFDRSGRLWISWENNRHSSRLEDGDNYTGDRCCAAVCYENSRLFESGETGRWLFKSKNDHWPTFHRDLQGNLFLLTHCGGDFNGNPNWQFRVSRLDPASGWAEPVTLLQTKQKGESLRPAVAFDGNGSTLWLAWKSERMRDRDHDHPEGGDGGTTQRRRGMLEMNRFAVPDPPAGGGTLNLRPTTVEEHHRVAGFVPEISGRPRPERQTLRHGGETYTLLVGNLHEHSEISSCWPAGTDGTLHDDYRYGLCSEGYDFMAMTDHGYSLTEVYWRKHLRLADFYNDPPHLIVLPAMEWTLSNAGQYEIRRGAGHRNILFGSTADARRFVRNADEVYSVRSPETADAEKLWRHLRGQQLDCVSIPHHPADEVHACCWETRDEQIEPVVEIFQCRGNAEYRGAPRMINVERHKPTDNDRAFVDYALREKGYRLGFVASGDHNSMGVGLACLWVKEVSRQGILEALRSRRVFATTGDQIVMDFQVNDVLQGQSASSAGPPRLSYDVTAVDEIESVDLLRNSRLIKSIRPAGRQTRMTGEFVDELFERDNGVLYYYARVRQKNNHLAWSSPVWL